MPTTGGLRQVGLQALTQLGFRPASSGTCLLRRTCLYQGPRRNHHRSQLTLCVENGRPVTSSSRRHAVPNGRFFNVLEPERASSLTRRVGVGFRSWPDTSPALLLTNTCPFPPRPTILWRRRSTAAHLPRESSVAGRARPEPSMRTPTARGQMLSSGHVHFVTGQGRNAREEGEVVCC